MKIFVLGATGSTGRHILDLAVSRGHHVTAFVRSPQKITRTDVKVVKGDPMNAYELAAAMAGHDVVLSALGPRFPEAFRPHTLLGDAATSTVQAMKMAGVPRLEVVSAALMFPEKGLRFRIFRWLLRQHIRDLTVMEQVVRDANLDWIIARPPRLVDKAEERYREERDMLPKKGFVMSFRAVAAFLLDALESHTWSRAVVGLAR